jgi:hypothetical protein
MDRRAFLKLFGVGAATAIVAPQLLAPEPERRIWQVGFGATRDVHGVGAVYSGQMAALYHAIALEHRATWDAAARSFGYDAPGWDASPLQEMYDEIAAKAADNLASYGKRIGARDITFNKPAPWDHVEADRQYRIYSGKLTDMRPSHSVLITSITSNADLPPHREPLPYPERGVYHIETPKRALVSRGVTRGISPEERET